MNCDPQPLFRCRDLHITRYESLQANLVFLADTGRRTFIEAEQQMDKLVMHSRYLFSDTGVVSLLGVATDVYTNVEAL